MPKISGKMNDREQGICARVREFRLLIKWSQPDFAARLGITRNRLACLEYGCTPLSYQLGTDLCVALDVNGEWLATGKGSIRSGKRRLWEVDFPLEQYGRSLFSEVHDASPDLFKTESPNVNYPVGGNVSIKASIFLHGPDIIKERVASLAGDVLKKLPPKLHWSFSQAMYEAAHEFIAMNAEEIKGTVRMSGEKNSLQASSLKGKPVDVKTELEKLLARVRRAADKPGAKAALARLLDVAPARITEWLTEDATKRKEPGGMYALQLLRWVELQERKLK